MTEAEALEEARLLLVWADGVVAEKHRQKEAEK